MLDFGRNYENDVTKTEKHPKHKNFYKMFLNILKYFLLGQFAIL